MSGRSLTILLALTVLGTRPAGAFVRTTTDKNMPVVWPRACVIVTAHVADPPANLTPELAAAAARAAAAVWSRQAVTCTGFELQIATAGDADAPVGNDAMNNLVFRKAAWEYEPTALAITTVFAIQSTGAILDADVELNAVTGGRFKWGDLIAGVGSEGGAEDLQNTLTHEFGHLLGLDHNCFLAGSTSRRGTDNAGIAVPECDRASAEVQDATMFASVTRGDILRRTLAPDDLAGVCAIYPPSTATSCTTTPDDPTVTGCSLGGGQRSGAGLVLVAAAIWLSARRRRRARPRG